jgi:protein SCO1/2
VLYRIILCLCLSFTVLSSEAQTAGLQSPGVKFDRATALSISQAVLGNDLPDLSFTKVSGESLALRELQGKPLVISLIYTSCYHICPTTTKHLHKVVRKARAALGTDSFNVLTIGFDVQKDSPQMMQFFADQQGVSDAGWYFLSADQATIDALADALGFIYYATAHGFDHLIQATVIKEDGEIFRQIYGINFETPLLVEPLKQLVFKTSPDDSLFSSLSNQVKLFCTVYDPAVDKYKFDYSLFIGMFIGFLCVGLLGFQLVREWRRTIAG